MKPFYFVAALAVLGSGSVKAQNVQFHYDLGHSLSKNLTTRPSVTTTVEMFKPDRWGNTFFFIDLDYYSRGMAGAYWEISREFDLSKNKQFAAHIEYNGGVSTAEDMTYASRFQQAVLVGPAWNWHSADFSKTFSVQTLYKYYFRGQHDEHAFSSFQLTGVWGLNFGKSFTFSGFIDFWRGEDADGHGQLVILSEPQLWYNANKHLSLGGEIEISNNFIYNTYDDKSFFINPTLALKWNF